MPVQAIRTLARRFRPDPERIPDRVHPVDVTDPAPVVLAHGFLDTWRTPWWETLTDHFVDAGWSREHIYQVTTGAIPGTTVGSPRDYAEDVQAVLERAHDRHGQPVSLLGHSMGGLNARWCVERGDGAALVRDLVTVGTPHQGTYLAYLGLPTAGGRSMVPSSSFIRDLNVGGLEPSIRYTAVGSRRDRLIVPRRSALLPQDIIHEDTENIALESASHMQLLHDPGVVSEYIDRLA